jgi:hypothetical protein
MNMGTIGKAMKASRTQMIESATEMESEKFTRWFGMRDGDYIRYRKTGHQFKQARIVSVESVYSNQAGGWTAEVTVAPLLVSGKLGKTRSLYLAVTAAGSGLHGVHFCDDVERVGIVTGETRHNSELLTLPAGRVENV